MKYGLYLFLSLGILFSAFFMAQSKMEHPLNLSDVRLGMGLTELEKTFGSPSAKLHNQFVYILADDSELTVTLRDKIVSSAKVKFQRQIKIQDPEMKKLTLVQMEHHGLEQSPSWFFAGKPEEGLIYKITSEGIIESLTWIPPFSLGQTHAKNLQALLLDFKTQRSL